MLLGVPLVAYVDAPKPGPPERRPWEPDWRVWRPARRGARLRARRGAGARLGGLALIVLAFGLACRALDAALLLPRRPARAPAVDASRRLDARGRHHPQRGAARGRRARGQPIVAIETPQPRHAHGPLARAARGRGVRSVDAHGKHLFIRFEGDLTLHSHLRMGGSWGVYRRGQRWRRARRVAPGS